MSSRTEKFYMIKIISKYSSTYIPKSRTAKTYDVQLFGYLLIKAKVINSHFYDELVPEKISSSVIFRVILLNA